MLRMAQLRKDQQAILTRCLSAKGPLFVGKSTADGYKQQGYRHVFVAQELLSSFLSLLQTESCFPMHIQLQPTNAGNEKQTSRHTLTERPNNPCTHKVKIFSILYKTHTVLNLILAKIRHEFGHITAIFPLFQPLSLSCFAHITCILHHFAFLVWPKARNFSSPNTHF